MSDLQIAKDLRAAADYLRTFGWTRRGTIGDPGEPRCAGGALYSAIGIDFFADRGCAIRPHLVALGFTADVVWEMHNPFTIACWNDTPERTVEQVLDRLESTALALEIKHLAATQPAESVPEPALT
jgi:hypothetical protein